MVPRRTSPGDLDRHDYHGQTSKQPPARGEIMNLLALYLREFNREYLTTREDRRHFRKTLVSGLLYMGGFLVAVLVLYLLLPASDF